MSASKKNSSENWTPHLKVAIQAAQAAAKIQLASYDKAHTVNYKAETDLVTEVDRKCEETIVRIIKKAYPAHDFLLEETHIPKSESSFLWVVDPLDATTNYAHRYPHFCCSIALQYCSRTVLGVVLDPMREELYTAIENQGAFLNGKALSVSTEDRLIRSLLATGFPKDIKKAKDKNLRKFARILPLARSIRRSGSAALDLCFVAAGRLDGYWVLTLEAWDAAAGILMIKEAGGTVTDNRGQAPSLRTKALVASNGRIHRHLFNLVYIS